MYALESSHEDNRISYKQAGEVLDFKIKLVEEFSGTTNEEINKIYTRWAPHINGGIPQVIYKGSNYHYWETEYSWNIGLDMICNKYGMITILPSCKGDIFAVPLNQTNLIEFIDKNLPSFGKVIKRLHGK